MGEIKRGWKTVSFWVTLLGNVASLLAAMKGILPTNVALICGVALTAFYNILRGAQKSEEMGIREWWKTSEFWLSAGTMASTSLVSLQQGGVNDPWVMTANSILAGVMTVARDLSNKQPETPKP